MVEPDCEVSVHEDIQASKQMILLYANQPVAKYDGRYYTRNRNFVDFLAVLAALSDDYRLVVPVYEGDGTETTAMTMELPANTVEAAGYRSHVAALFASLRNLPLLRRLVSEAKDRGETVTVAGPGPNSTLFILSWFLPRGIHLAYFIRGDTVETVRNMYRGRRAGWLALMLVRLFRWRIRRLLSLGRAQVLAYGPHLAADYGRFGPAASIAPLIDRAVLADRPAPLSDGPLRLLFIGRLSEEKGLLPLLEALEQVHRSGRDCRLTLVGYGPQEAALWEAVTRRGLEDQVVFAGFVRHGPELYELIDSHHCLCLTSRTEGTPRVVVEALARYRPVLATPVGSLPEQFAGAIHFTTGFDADAIADGIAWCDDHRDELDEMSSRGRRLAEHYLIPRQAQIVDQLLRSGTPGNIQ